MKRNLLIIAILSIFSSFIFWGNAHALTNIYGATCRIGAAACVDGIDVGNADGNGTDLAAGDICVVVMDAGSTEPEFYVYRLYNSGTAESDPTVIKPDLTDGEAYSGNFRWHLVNLYGKSVNSSGSATPGIGFYDSDCTDDDKNANIYVNCTATGTGAEDCRIYFQAQIDGTLTTLFNSGDDGSFTFTSPIVATTLDIGATDTTLARASAGNITVEGNAIYRAGGTDVPVTDGGTGLSAGTEGGVPWFTTTTALASSALLAANSVMIGGGIDAAPSTITNSTTVTHALFSTAGAPAFRALATADLPAALPAASTMATSLTVPDVILTSITAGARLTAGNGLLTIKGEGDGTDENLILNLNSADVATVSSGTGVTSVNFSALNLVTTGTIQGAINTTKDDDTLAADQCYGTAHWYSGGAETITLPAAVVGMNLLIYASDATVKHIDPNGTDTIVLNGVALTAGYQIESPGAVGDFIALVCFTANQWTTLGRSGTWVTHGAD